MPLQSDVFTQDRVSTRATRVDMHPTLTGDLIALPDDIFEGSGNFVTFDAKGSPVGWTVGEIEKPDGRHVYIGTSLEECIRQTHSPLSVDRPSHLVNYRLQNQGPLPPTANTPLLAKLPPPDAPTIEKTFYTKDGFPGSTPESPYWFAWAKYVDGKLSAIGQAIQFDLLNGQSMRVPVPAYSGEGKEEIALCVSEPGKSRPTRPGPMYAQRIVNLQFHAEDTYDLTGPYRRDPKLLVSTTNQTTLARADKPEVDRTHTSTAARVARYQPVVSYTDASGETLASPIGASITISRDSGYSQAANEETQTEEIIAGRGTIKVSHKNAPKTATGWRVYVYCTPVTGGTPFTAGWTQVVDKKRNYGASNPFPIGVDTVEFAGWMGDEDPYGRNDRVTLAQAEPPIENTTGVGPPVGEPSAVVLFGSTRPDPGIKYWVQVTDTLRGAETLPSPPATVENLAYEEIMSILFTDPENLVPNGDIIETDPDNRPLYWTIDPTGINAFVEDKTLVLETSAETAGTTGTTVLPKTNVDVTKHHTVSGAFVVLQPKTGQHKGYFEVKLRQTNAAGAQTEHATPMRVATKPGEYEFQFEVVPFGTTPGANQYAFLADTVHIRAVCRFVPTTAGGAKHCKVKFDHCKIHKERHKPRRPRRKKRPPVIQEPPQPPTPPENEAIDHPDRPMTVAPIADILATLDYESTVFPPTGWTRVISGSTTVERSIAAPLMTGTAYMEVKKATAGAATGYLTRTFPSTTVTSDRTRQAIASRLRVALFPVNGRATVAEIARASDSWWVAAIEASSQQEISTLTFEENPTKGGPVGVSLNGQPSPAISVASTREIATLAITTSPTQTGTVRVGLNGKVYSLVTGGVKEHATIKINQRANDTGYVKVYLNGTTYSIKVYNGDSASTVASRIANASYSGWTTSRVSETVTFIATLPGPRQNTSYNHNSTGATANVTTIAEGASQTKEQLATQLAQTFFEGYFQTVGVAPNAHVVTFTATTDGPRQDLTFESGDTGIGTGFTVTTTQQGSMDTKEQLALKVKNTLFTGWTLTIDPTSTIVTFTRTDVGETPDSSWDPGLTGVSATMTTNQQGTNGNLTVSVRNKDGVIETRSLFTSLLTTDVVDIDLAVSGATTDRAVITAWVAVAGQTTLHAARFEDVDLTGVPVGIAFEGVTRETSPGLTYTIHYDTTQVTERGLKYFRDHNDKGEWIGQIHRRYDSKQPVRQDVLLQGGEGPSIPGASYRFSLFARATNTSPIVPARLAVIHAHTPGGKRHELTTLATIAVSSKLGWEEYVTPSVVIPPNCYRVTATSRNISGGEYILQEVVGSPGTTIKRTMGYAANSSYETILDLHTPGTELQPAYAFWTRERRVLRAPIVAPDGTTISPMFSSATTRDGTYSTPVADPLLVPDRRFVKITFTATSPSRRDTAMIPAGSPYCEYVLKVGPKRMSTLLDGQRRQLPGGTAFISLPEWARITTTGRRRLPSGELIDDPAMFEAIGHLAASKLMVFSTDTRRYLQENWRAIMCIEAYGEALDVKLAGPPGEFVKETYRFAESETGLYRTGIYSVELPDMQVLKAVPLP